MNNDEINGSDLPIASAGDVTHVWVQDGRGNAPVRASMDRFTSQIGHNLGTVGGISAGTWSELLGIAGSYVGQGAQVPDSDTGNHTDPVVGGTKANAGSYSWQTSPATGWRWDSATGLALKADAAALTALDGRVVRQRPLPTLGIFGGTATAYTSADSAAYGAYFHGQSWIGKVGSANGANATLNVNDGVVTNYGAKPLVDDTLTALPAGFTTPTGWYRFTVIITGGNTYIIVTGATEVLARIAAVSAEAGSRTTAINAEATTRGNADTRLAGQRPIPPLTTWGGDSTNYTAFDTGKQGAHAEGLEWIARFPSKNLANPTLNPNDGTTNYGAYPLVDEFNVPLPASWIDPTIDYLLRDTQIGGNRIIVQRACGSQNSMPAPTAGWMDDGHDSESVLVEVDPSGQPLYARGRGDRHLAVDFLQTPGGLARRETPVDRSNELQNGATGQATTVTSLAIVIAPFRVPLGTGYRSIIPNKTFDSPSPTRDHVTAEAHLIRYGVELSLDYQFIDATGVVVTDVVSGLPLVENSDYGFNRTRGIIYSLNPADASVARSVTLEYYGFKQRVDLVTLNTSTLDLTLTQGTAVKRAPAMWAPSPPVNELVIYKVLRWVDSTVTDRAEISPTVLWRKRHRVGREWTYESWVSRNRRLLQKSRHLLRTASNFCYPYTGDSISSMGVGADPLTLATTPNGAVRDRSTYFALYDAATLALMDPANKSHVSYDGSADGAGAAHIEEGMHWGLVKFLRSKYPATIIGLNYAIAGSRSTADLFPGSIYEQGHPTREAAFLGNTPARAGIYVGDLFGWATGMNELGQDYTYGNMVTQVGNALALAQKPEGIIWLPPRPSPDWLSTDQYEPWRFTCEELKRVAIDMDVACVDTSWCFAHETIGAMGFWQKQLTECTLLNHPGKIELDGMATLASDFF